MSSHTSVDIVRKLIESKIQKLHELLDKRKLVLNEVLDEIEEAFATGSKEDQEELEKWRNYRKQTLELYQDDVAENVQLSKIDARIGEVSRTLELRQVLLEWDDDKVKMEISIIGSLGRPGLKPKSETQQITNIEYETMDNSILVDEYGDIPSENYETIDESILDDIPSIPTKDASLGSERTLTPKETQFEENTDFPKRSPSEYLEPMKLVSCKKPAKLIPRFQELSPKVLKKAISKKLSSNMEREGSLYGELPEQKPGWQLHFSHKSEENSNQTGLYPTPKPEDCTVISTCTRGADQGKILKPKNIAVSPKTGCIFVAEKGNNRVQVFTPTGEPSFSFGTRGGKLSMAAPYGVCVLNEKVFVSQSESHCIMVFRTNGDYCMQGGNKGKNEGSFEYPTGLSTDGTNILVCDFGNNRVQVFSNKLHFRQIIGVGKLTNPADIAVDLNSNSVVLDRSPTCVHIFNSKGVYQRKLINVSKCPTLSNPLFIAISPRGNIVLSDLLTCSVNVFTMDGQLLWSLGGLHDKETFGEPRGVACDPLGRLVVVCNKERGCLKIMEIRLPNLF